MQITEITIHPTNEDLVKAYVSIVFDNCFMVGEIKIIQGPTGLFLSFQARSRETALTGSLRIRPMLKRE